LHLSGDVDASEMVLALKVEEFKDPPVEYRPVPFLSVNDDVQEERLLSLGDEFFEKGWGGFFFHARSGLVTPYLGNRWFNLLKSYEKRCREVGSKLWLYDEKGWPSGQAGGQVPRLRPKFRSKLLLCSRAPRGKSPAGTIATQEVTEGGRRRKYSFFVKVMPAGYLADLLEPESVRAFLESTHELYGVHVKKGFGGTIPGIFTDEPQYATFHGLSREKALPWTDRLPEEFRKDHGYPLVENLASLFFDVGDHRKIRYHFFSTLTRLFVEAYSKQIYDWCEANHLAYTGHYEWEDSFLGQIRCIGSAMQHYEYMQQPGIDHLGRGIHNPWVEKQVSSVASQLGKRRVLSETYGVSGQGLSFHDRRWIGNWQYALGINFLCHHLALYSLRGARKRDYPPTLSPHQPWWKYNGIIAQYFTRLSYLLSQGKRVVDILVINSIGSAWCDYKPSDPSGAEKVSEGFKALTLNLLSSQLDFEYGDEFLLARHGSVEGGTIRVGRSKYKVVLLPPMTSLKETTFELLRKFSAKGGSVICVGARPRLVEGEESEILSSYVSRLPIVENTREGISGALNRFRRGPTLQWVSGAPMEKLLIHKRRISGGRLAFLVNTDYSLPMRLRIAFRRDGALELDPLTGKVMSCPRDMRIDLAAGEGRVFVEGLNASPEGKTREALGDPKSVLSISGPWRIRREDPNQCVLDYARWRVVGGEWSKVLPVWRAQDGVSKLDEGEEFEVRYEFERKSEGSLDLVVEDGHRLDIYLNDRKLALDEESWWLDPSFKRIPIGNVANMGKNVIILRGRRTADLDIEDAYLLGDFAVKVRGSKTPLLEEEEGTCQDISDLRGKGYAFYAGSIMLSTEIETKAQRGRAYIEFDELGGTVVEVWVNGHDVGTIFWRDYRLDVTEFLTPGRNLVSLRLVNSLRNLLGPRHWRGDEFTGVNPRSFKDAQGWTDGYVGIPTGITGLRVVWR